MQPATNICQFAVHISGPDNVGDIIFGLVTTSTVPITWTASDSALDKYQLLIEPEPAGSSYPVDIEKLVPVVAYISAYL